MISAVLFLAGLSVALATLLMLANRFLWVYEDPRIGEVSDALPGANCGACGLPGCRAFAERVVKGEIQPSGCPVGGPETAIYIAQLLGIEAGHMEKKVARLLCAGGSDVAYQVGEYRGFPSCRAAATVTGGFKECTYGCLGLADCEVACTFDAIRMGTTGLPIVDVDLCTACGDCVTACPKDLFELLPLRQKLVVQCKSLLEGDEALARCRVACTACARCEADAPEGLITMEHHLPVIHRARLDVQSEIATYRCPTNAIVWIEDQQFPDTHAEVWGSNDTRQANRAVSA